MLIVFLKFESIAFSTICDPATLATSSRMVQTRLSYAAIKVAVRDMPRVFGQTKRFGSVDEGSWFKGFAG